MSNSSETLVYRADYIAARPLTQSADLEFYSAVVKQKGPRSFTPGVIITTGCLGAPQSEEVLWSQRERYRSHDEAVSAAESFVSVDFAIANLLRVMAIEGKVSRKRKPPAQVQTALLENRALDTLRGDFAGEQPYLLASLYRNLDSDGTLLDSGVSVLSSAQDGQAAAAMSKREGLVQAWHDRDSESAHEAAPRGSRKAPDPELRAYRLQKEFKVIETEAKKRHAEEQERKNSEVMAAILENDPITADEAEKLRRFFASQPE